MTARSPALVPLLFRFPAAAGREDGWGRFLRLHPRGGRVSTRFRLEEGDLLFVSFRARGESFDGVPARVDRLRRDADGYFDAELRLDDEVEVRRLGAALRGLLAATETA